MKIAIVNSFYRRAVPSGENVAVQLQAEALRSAGHEVHMISRETDELIDTPSYAIRSATRVATGAGFSPLGAIKRINPDLVHAHNLFPNWSTNWVQRLDVPLVCTIHNFRSVCSAGTLMRNGAFCDLCPTSGSHHAVLNGCYQDSRLATIPLAIASRKNLIPPLFSASKAIIFPSERTRALYDGYGLGFPEKASVIPHFTTPYENPPRDYKRHGFGSWAFVGRLSPEKGITPLIRHWPSKVRLDVVGSGPELLNCEREARGKEVYFHGQKSREEVQAILKASTGLLFPSVCSESAPSLVYLEALALGLPVIALSGSSVADDVELAETGVTISTLGEVSEALQIVDRKRDIFEEAARKRFSERFTREVWVANVERLYRRAMM